VAFKRIYISSLPNNYLDRYAAPIQLLPIERYVFIIALCIDVPLPRPPLNDGQNIHKKRVPTIAIVSEL
jgi:hypothetical protein